MRQDSTFEREADFVVVDIEPVALVIGLVGVVVPHQALLGLTKGHSRAENHL